MIPPSRPDTAPPRRRARLARRVAAAMACAAIVLAGAAAGYGVWVLRASRPALEGMRRLPGLEAPVTITRDAAGVPTLVARTRPDLARALGFLHGQERFFQMDLLRRLAAGELAELVGPAALDLDRTHRLHRFRTRARAVLARQDPADRALLAAYTAGVNAGRTALAHDSFEYTLLRIPPAPWRDEDSLLVVYAMYFDLQDADGTGQRLRAALRQAWGPEMAAFLDPELTPLDAPADGSTATPPAMPAALPARPSSDTGNAAPPAPERGSNNFAVSGRLTATGSAMVADDMHLGLMVPNIWYRARQVLRPAPAAAPTLDLTGVTLPGEPYQIVGTNTRVAWAFTDGYIESGDLIALDIPPGDPGRYQTPDGPKPFGMARETLCAAHETCHPLTIRTTIWGPVNGQDARGRPLVWHWSAEDEGAIDYRGVRALESAVSVRAALDAAHRAALPQENLLAGDRDGHIGWTIIGQVPRRVGLDDRLPHSWADGSHRWDGMLPPADIPEIVDPPGGRLWTANGRVVGGPALAVLGDGGYADGLRAGRLRDDLHTRDHFAEADLLAIQTDDHATVLRPWQAMLAAAIAARPGRADLAAMAPHVAAWGERARPESIGYRLVRQYRAHALAIVFGAYAHALPGLPGTPRVPPRAAWAVQRLLTERPPALLPPGRRDWTAIDDSILDALAADVRAAGGVASFRWGAANHVGIHHPLSRAVPLLGRLTDPPDLPEAGDTLVPRVAVPGFGASERLVVSPGHEDTALFDMPMGQSANPLSPYYGAGQEAWVDGTARPLLPGPARWTLTLAP
ncbi:penicillin amidase [Gluconacetobacter sacchari DSM 12717]|uniref:Penicillin acylase family protein n=2 Tax=Gluconacetobacter sacchari TaxID=92759 RepID=A0A7W4IAJ5_9PROT|nr:penicillin acylase family protein [Gluconacetobacter sacchari]MBB2159295.1 penicillin acylase family protein [Gluconacetobacter sacchari]GBQ26751.1 penicillin amidase [Gluconacetobacter sacchari DSM 12717]